MPTEPNQPNPQPEKSPAVQRGDRILAGQHEPVEAVLALVDELKQERKFWLGRKLLDRYAEREEVRQHPDARLRRKFGQQRALCTYKDPDLPAEERLDRALGLLGAADPLDNACQAKAGWERVVSFLGESSRDGMAA